MTSNNATLIRHHRSFSRPFAAPHPPLTFSSIPLPPGTSTLTTTPDKRPRARQHIRLRLRLPPSVSPTAVLSTLHLHHPIIAAQPFVTSYISLPVPSSSALTDPFFRLPPPGPPVSSSLPPPTAYRITEKVPILPKIYAHTITFTSTFQCLPSGLRVRADAPAGVTLWTEYHVVRIREEDETDERGTTAAWELVEVVTVEASRWMMGFVSKSMEEAHRGLCRKVLDGLAGAREGKGGVRELKAMYQ